MKIIVKKTTELSDIDVMQYCKCHENVFLRPSSTHSFLNQYKSNCLGYSFHVLLYNDNNIIVGGYSLMPFIYDVSGEKKIFAYASALMIEKEYRGDFTNLFGLVKGMLKTARKNFSCIYIFPNDNADIVNKQLIKANRIGELDTYVHLYKIGDYKKSLRYINPITILFSKIFLACSKLSKNNKKIDFVIAKNRDDFETNRLNWSNYTRYQDVNMCATWKVSKFEGVEAAFLIDVYPLSKANFNKAVREMCKKEKRRVGLFIYVGCLSFCPTSMIKVPPKVAPKKFRFDVKLFDEDIPQEILFELKNWDINLSSYDLL